MFVASLGFSNTRSCYLQTGHFISSFSTWMPFLSFCLIALAMISSTMLNESGKGGHPCLILILEEKVYVFHH